MFAKLVIFTTLLATLAAATPVRRGQCDTGELQCCDNLQDPKDASTQALLALLGIALQNTDAQVGINCTPITVVGVAQGSACSAKPVCCTDNNLGSLVSAGCIPVSLN